MAVNEPKIKVDGIFITRVQRWHAPPWVERLPDFIAKNGRFLTYIRRFGTYGPMEILGQTDVQDLLTNSGRDWMHGMVYTNTASTQATFGANYLALSTDSGAPATGDQSLAGEQTGNGLARKQAQTLTHASGSNTTTLQAQWTCTGASVSAIVKVAAINATSTTTSAYTMVHEGTVTTANLQINDVYNLSVNTTLG
jgi:hypothetical protein